jgi:hypothetical protein
MRSPGRSGSRSRTAPLVVCFDDIQWAEETFLDSSSRQRCSRPAHPAARLHGAAGVADCRPGWRRCGWSRCGTRRPAPSSATPSWTRYGSGRPYLRRQSALPDGDGRPHQPERWRGRGSPDAARYRRRFDQLDEPERKVLERGAVEGELLHRGAVQALAPEETEVLPRLATSSGAICPSRLATASARGRIPFLPPPDPRRRLRGPSGRRSAPSCTVASRPG